MDDDEKLEHRGASGARIIIGKKWTTKLDVTRTGTFVRDQGAWLTRWDEINALPGVNEVLATGYIMETLAIPHLADIDVQAQLSKILEVLREQFWVKHAVPMFWDELTHATYVHQLSRDVESNKSVARDLRVKLGVFRAKIDFTTLPTGLTHGDCIIDNVAYRPDKYRPDVRSLVLIDPIPATNALPNIRAVDVGRLIQSAIGYESIRYRSSNGGLTDYGHVVGLTLNTYMKKTFDVNEARACLYFAIIHMLRGIRTTTPDTAARLSLWYATHKLIEVTEEWMR